MSDPARAVFDCNVLLQALLSSTGPAGQLVQAVIGGKVSLFVSQYVLEELRDVASRPKVANKFKLTSDVVERYCGLIISYATLVENVPHVFDFPRDPDDAHYVDLAIAISGTLIVSRDKDLLSLRDAATAEGQDFSARFPQIEILTPSEALIRL